jgi:hypothetical protein
MFTNGLNPNIGTIIFFNDFRIGPLVRPSDGSFVSIIGHIISSAPIVISWLSNG